MKGKKGISVLSAACLALTGMAGAFPALPEAAVVFAAASTAPAEAAVPAEVEKFCQDMLGALELYQQEKYEGNGAESKQFIYQYVSNQLKASLKQEKVPLSDFSEAAKKAGLNGWNLDTYLADKKDSKGEPVYDSEAGTVSLNAPLPEKKTLKNRILSIQKPVDYAPYYVYAAACEPVSGKPLDNMEEYVDYCDYDAEKEVYYRIGQPFMMEVDYNSDQENGKMQLRSYGKSDYYLAGGKLYALMHSETADADYKMSYSPVNIRVQQKDALTGELTERGGSLEAEIVYDENGKYVGYGDNAELRVDGLMKAVFPKDDTRRVEFSGTGTLWKTEAGEFQYELIPGDGCTVTAVCEDAKGSRAVTDNLVKSEGETTLIFTVTKTPEQIKKDTLSSMFSTLYFYSVEYVTGSAYFTADENAPDSLVVVRTDDEIAGSSYRPENLEWSKPYTVPYKVYIEYADQLFAKHSDLKKELGTRYDSKTDTVAMSDRGGVGGLGGANVMLDYVEEDGVITVRGAGCAPENDMTGYTIPEDAIENVDYFTLKENWYTTRYGIGQPKELKVSETEHGYQLISYTESNTLRVNDVLTERVYEKEPHDYSTPFTKMIYSPVTVSIIDNKTGLPVEVTAALDSKGVFTAATKDGKIKVTASEGIEKIYDGIGWRFPVSPLTFTVTGDCTVNGIDGKTLKATDKENTYALAAKDGMAEILLTVGKEPERGDISGDGVISVEDAQLTLKAYTEGVAGLESKLNPAQKKASDINGDGNVTVEDAQLILKYYTGKYVAGKDITWDDILKYGAELPHGFRSCGGFL